MPEILIEEQSTTFGSEEVECGFCGSEVPTSSTVPVAAYAGERWNTQQWCQVCGESQFGLPEESYGYVAKRRKQYITVETVAAFFLGLLLMLLVASVMVV